MIKISALERQYVMGGQTIRAVAGIDLEIREGESVALLGPSGSGKSTLMHLLGALDTPTSGRIEVDGEDIGGFNALESARYRSHKIGFVFQSFYLQSALTAIENVALPLKLAGVPRAERRRRALELLDLVGLGDRGDHRPNELSGGQQQRVSIARALANDPKLLLADEPTGNLDTKTSKEVMDLFLRLQKERGLTLVLVTHDPEVAAQTERVIRVRDGLIESIEGESSPSESRFQAAPRLARSRAAAAQDAVGDVALSFRRHPLRTLLTAFGIAIGGLAITLMVGLGFGLHDFILTQAESINDPLSLWVVNSSYSWNDIVSDRAQQLGKPPQPMKERSLEMLARARGGFEPFTDEQIEEIRSIPGVSSVRPRSRAILDGIRLVPTGEERLDPTRPEASDVNGGPESFEDVYYIGYTLVRGGATPFRLESGARFDDGDRRALVLSYQYAEAWGLTPSGLVGREVELLFPDLSDYRRFSSVMPTSKTASYRAFRARVSGVTRKSIMSSAVFLSPKMGEDVTRFQFQGRMPSGGGGMETLINLQELARLTGDAAFMDRLKQAGGERAKLGKTLTALTGSLKSGGSGGGSAGLFQLMGQLGALRGLATSENLAADLEDGSSAERRLGHLLRTIFEAEPAKADDDSAPEDERRWGSKIRVRAASEEVLPQVIEGLTEKGYRVRSLQENLKVVAQVFGVLDAFLSSFGLIALVVAALGIANTLIMAVYERTQEIGVMKAVGATEGQIRRMFALEAAAIGLVGGLIGMLGGVGFGLSFNQWGVQWIAADWQGFEFFSAPLHLLIGTVVFCTLLGLAAGLYPAYRASRLDPIIALRSD